MSKRERPPAPRDAYAESGVRYDVLDSAKRRSLAAAATTLELPLTRGAVVDRSSLGEPAARLRLGERQLAVVLECLGTKSIVAREVSDELGTDRFSDVGIDAVAAIVNDLCCVGALPLAVNAYFATGSAGWYSGDRHAFLVDGWAKGCREAGAAWVGGESPTLSGIVSDGEIDIAGSAVGAVPDGCRPWSADQLEAGDEIVLVSSNGLHANGASLARKVAAGLPERWATELPSGRRLGEAVLDPSVIYVRLVEALQRAAGPLQVGYGSHVTGHGFRKLMRAERELTYRIHTLPAVPEVLSFLSERAGLSDREAYGTFNQGAGFALYVAAGGGQAVVELALRLGYGASVAGVVETGRRRVILEPIGVSYESEELSLR